MKVVSFVWIGGIATIKRMAFAREKENPMDLISKISVDTEDVSLALELIKEFNFEVEKSNHLLKEQLDMVRKVFETTVKYNEMCKWGK